MRSSSSRGGGGGGRRRGRGHGHGRGRGRGRGRRGRGRLFNLKHASALKHRRYLSSKEFADQETYTNL